ncbi:PocR ligand-binding domain-containing protein [Clostridium estertheticum]|uniref:PocR ligand-binding domain-containing protein n=1 Tax=Clostridium estertheticum TaxID=238834 RepID=UPI0013E92F36|nr:PocR ligand-binding domain-containing protein [Clostridium estertheticum]MBZ9686417.1 PocR ligand-binding domain-containing protein [Clostridium estertheticum]
MNYELSNLIDICQLQNLLNSFYNATGISTGIVARDGTILTATAWKDLCTKFHRINPKSQLRCVESDAQILKQLENGDKFLNFKCKNGLTDLGVPIIVEGVFLATIFAGQVLFEEPDIEYFKRQAKEFGFDEDAYLKALKEIPIVNREGQEKILQFLKDFSEMISVMGLKQLKLLESQKKLILSEEQYKLALYGSNDGMWDWTFEDNNLHPSRRFLQILGYTEQEANSLFPFFKELLHPDDKDCFTKEINHHMHDKTSHFHQETRIKIKNGDYKWVLVRGAAIWNDENIAIRMAGSLTDLSNQKSSEKLLKKEQDFSKTIIDNANVIICMFNPDGSLVKLNKYGEDISGYSEESVLGYKWVNTICPTEIREKALSTIRSFKPSITTTQFESPIVNKNGLLLTILWSYQIIYNEDESIKNVIGMGLDITQRKNEEKRLTEFFANISHELRTPLNIIFSTLQLIDLYDSKNLTSENICKLIKHKESMKQNCYRLMRLVNNLIDITKIDARFLELDLQECDIVSLIEDITLSVSEYMENKSLNLIFDTDVEEKILWCDPDKIERIILNLLSNAVKFTKPFGSIFVTLYNKEQSILISVKDTGIGIENDKLDMIFERFKQVNKSFTREQEGSGIGLSLVKALVIMHNGSIEVKSIYGSGSEFIIEIPINEPIHKTTHNSSNALCNKQHYNIEFSDIYFN